ncbi:hypothetical protein [Spirillospora sp. NPDC047279]|uniref:hypothetical protein n=1 Tax=Spirillospora sp. NPDC047279 TaxID=3155478 RepID=UPI0033CA5CDB
MFVPQLLSGPGRPGLPPADPFPPGPPGTDQARLWPADMTDDYTVVVSEPATHGRGLPIVAALAGDLVVHRCPSGGKAVVARRHRPTTTAV